MALRVIVVFVCLVASRPAFGADCSWTGAGPNNKWSTTANWSGCGATGRPANGDNVSFPDGAARGVNENDLVGLRVRIISIRGRAAAQTRWSITGAAIILTEMIDVATLTDTTGLGATFLVPVILGANAFVSNTMFVNAPLTGALDLGHVTLNGFELSFDIYFPVRVTGAIAGAGTIRKSGAGELRLNENSYTGQLQIADGRVVAAHVHALGASGAGNETHVADGGILDVQAGSIGETLRLAGSLAQSGSQTETTMTGPIVLGGGMSPPRIVNQGTLTIAGPITKGAGVTFIKGDSGTLVVSNAANQWDMLVIRGGTVRVGAAGAIPDAGAVFLDFDSSPHAFDLNGHDETIGALLGDETGRVLIGSATLTINSTFSSAYEGSLVGNGTLRKAGPNNLTLSGPRPLAFTGTTIVESSTLVLHKGAGAGLAGSIVVNSGGILFWADKDQIDDASAVTVNAGGFLLLNGWTDTIGSLAGAGEVRLSQGTLTIGANNASTVFAGTITGLPAPSGGPAERYYRVIKIGTGTLTLTGTSAIADIASVRAGTLVVNGTLGGNQIEVNGGRLEGTGTLAGPGGVIPILNLLHVVAGTIAPGTPIGILHAEDVRLTGRAVLNIEIGRTASGTTNDQLAITGNLFLSGSPALSVHRGLSGPPAGSAFRIVDIAAGKSAQGTFANLPEGGTFLVQEQKFTITYRGGDGNDVVITALEGPPTRSYFLSEGATGTFFDTDVLIANANDVEAPITLTFFKEDGEQVVTTRTLAPRSHATVHVDQVPGLEATAASVRVTSDIGLPLFVERTMFWDATSYAGHTGSAMDVPRSDWFFAEGSQGFFDTFVLVVNPNATAADVTFTFLLENDAPVIHTVPLGPFARLTLAAGSIPTIVGRSFGINVHATQPIMAERSMYFGSTATRQWSGGHESAGVAAAATHWLLAEGATGSFFDTFILLSNPQSASANVTLEYLLDAGDPIRVTKTIDGHARLTINIEAEEDPRLRNAAVSTVVSSDVPIIAERSMYWPGAAVPWGEGHNSFGVPRAFTTWGLAEGRLGGPLNFHTYILLANAEAAPADVRVTYLRENGAPIVKTYVVPAKSRFTIDTSGVDGLANESSAAEMFGAEIVATNGIPIVVERSLYWDTLGFLFSGGTNATGMPVP